MTIKRHVRDEHLRKISVSVLGWIFPWMFRRPLAGHLMFFFGWVQKIPEVCVASGKSFREKSL